MIISGYLFAVGCSSSPPTSEISARITCSVTADCSARGGTCVGNQCVADNECTSDTDCAVGETCVADDDFGGLCTAANQPPMPEPAWSCSVGKDCPAHQGCGSDGKCHVDGECHNTWQDGYLVGDCADQGEMCAASGDPLAGFCTSDRGGPDPYCRSTGNGECRGECTEDEQCGGFGNTCVDGFCHGADDCYTDADCTPNHECISPEGWDDYGYERCAPVDNPTCIPSGNACRLACETDTDCLLGGGCEADGKCHASNECSSAADCDPGLLCYADAHFGGLCGPERPE